MKATDRHPTPRHAAGFTLPAILVIASALLILAVGLMMISGIERQTARSYVNFQRAELAARAGLEEVRAILHQEAANDDFLIIAAKPREPGEGEMLPAKEQVPYLYLARGRAGGAEVSYRYAPLFSTASSPGDANFLSAPEAESLIGGEPKDFETLPWMEKALTAWIPVTGEDGKTVGRYAFWVEDLQGKLDPKVSGNTLGTNGIHERQRWPNPSSMPLLEGKSTQNVIALHALDPQSGDKPRGDLTDMVIRSRPAMLSPDSILGALGVAAPLARDSFTGILQDPLAATLEKNVSPVLRSYTEQPLVPFARGIHSSVIGRPKLNLNRLLAAPRSSAVDDFANWVSTGLPNFVKREGGFPEDYLKTLAAGAFDYADEDKEPTILKNVYRGIDGAPFLSEIVLRIEYMGSIAKNNRRIMNWKMTLFGEFWNMTNQEVSGQARLSYEVALNTSPIGAGGRGRPFDDPYFLDDSERSSHNLTFMDGRYLSSPQSVTLRPDEYKFYKFAEVSYAIDIGANNINLNTPFTLTENESEARGVSVFWNSQEVERVHAVHRDPFGMEFNMINPRQGPNSKGKAAISGGSYVKGPYPSFYYNMGDPRISHYMRTSPLAENSYPDNISPNRRNVRRGSIYDVDSAEKRLHYGRVMPSEWPDGGHDSPLGNFNLLNQSLEPFIFGHGPEPYPRNAPMRISNEGRFFSATELGNVYDPVMWHPIYPDRKGAPGSGLPDSQTLQGDIGDGKGRMPATRNVWPDVSNASYANNDFGGGNTLRIGRPEHQGFDKPGWRASHLLDLFHAGIAHSENEAEREGPVVEIKGHVNVNTAGEDALRALAAGMLMQDPELRRVTSRSHEVPGRYTSRSQLIELGTPTKEKAADQIARAIIRSRPFASAAELASAENEQGDPVFGNRELYDAGNNIEWTDAAAEEVFGRIYNSSTFRSRNFRVWVIGQAITGSEKSPEVLSESRKVYTIFADPGERASDGSIVPQNTKVRIIHENDF